MRKPLSAILILAMALSCLSCANIAFAAYSGYNFDFAAEDITDATAASEYVSMDFADGSYDTSVFNSAKNTPTFVTDAEAIDGDGYMDLSGSTENGIWKTTTTLVPEKATIEFDADVSEGLGTSNTNGFYFMYVNTVTGARIWAFFSSADGSLRDVKDTATAIWTPAGGISDLSGKKHYKFVVDGTAVTFYFNNSTVGTSYTINTATSNKGRVRLGAAANKGAKIYSFTINALLPNWTTTAATQENGVVTLESSSTSSARLAKNTASQLLTIPEKYSFETSIKYISIPDANLTDLATGDDIRNMNFLVTSSEGDKYRVWLCHDKDSIYYVSTVNGGFWNKIADYPISEGETYVYRVDVDGNRAKLYINNIAVGNTMTLSALASNAGRVQIATRAGSTDLSASCSVSYITVSDFAGLPSFSASLSDMGSDAVITDGKGTLRFLTKANLTGETPATELFGTYMIPQTIFEGSFASDTSAAALDAAEVSNSSDSLSDGQVYAADLTNIPSEFVSTPIYAWSFIKLEGEDMIINILTPASVSDYAN